MKPMIDNIDREGLEKLDNERLLKEYAEMSKASFNNIFGRNAKRRFNACVEELHKRNIYFEPNIFGDMEIKYWQ
jgi:hypothetical protein